MQAVELQSGQDLSVAPLFKSTRALVHTKIALRQLGVFVSAHITVFRATKASPADHSVCGFLFVGRLIAAPFISSRERLCRVLPVVALARAQRSAPDRQRLPRLGDQDRQSKRSADLTRLN